MTVLKSVYRTIFRYRYLRIYWDLSSAGSGGTPPRRILKYVYLHNITCSQSHRCMCDIVQVCTISPVHIKGSMNQLKQLINEYTQTRDQWLEASRLRINRASKNSVLIKQSQTTIKDEKLYMNVCGKRKGGVMAIIFLFLVGIVIGI